MKAHATAPPWYSTSRTGSLHDFNYFAGAWTTHQRRLKARDVGSNEWEEVPTVDELYMPTNGIGGMTLRTFDSEKHQWSIYWISRATGRLDPVPVVGCFQGKHGEFCAADHDSGRPIKGSEHSLWRGDCPRGARASIPIMLFNYSVSRNVAFFALEDAHAAHRISEARRAAR